jgi:hypothetical protein
MAYGDGFIIVMLMMGLWYALSKLIQWTAREIERRRDMKTQTLGVQFQIWQKPKEEFAPDCAGSYMHEDLFKPSPIWTESNYPDAVVKLHQVRVQCPDLDFTLHAITVQEITVYEHDL